MRSWAERKHCHRWYFLRVAEEGYGAAAAALPEAERVNHEAWGSLLKKWLWWMLSIVLSRLHIEAAWLIWPDFSCEQRLRVAYCPLQRWLQPQLTLHMLVHNGTLSCSIKRWNLIPFLLNLGRLETALTKTVWCKWCSYQLVEPQIWGQNKMMIALCH